MARRPRLHVPGGFYHVTLRGNHRNPIFFSDADRDLLDRIVAEGLSALSARLHAYCWMTNHIHMLVQVSDEPLGGLVRRIASGYARTVQLRLDTTGHLFERRYHAHLVDANQYLLTLVQYIHLNPVRAGMVADPAAYPWSSHRVYLGSAVRPWVTTSFVMHTLSDTPDSAQTNYRRLMCPTDLPRWGAGMLVPNPKQPQILGDECFAASVAPIERVDHAGRSLSHLLDECSRRFAISVPILVSPLRSRRLTAARAWLAHEAVAGGASSICGVARILGRSEGAIRQAMNRHPRDAQSDSLKEA